MVGAAAHATSRRSDAEARRARPGKGNMILYDEGDDATGLDDYRQCTFECGPWERGGVGAGTWVDRTASVELGRR